MSRYMIYTKTYVAPPIDESEILRYAGVREKTPDMLCLMHDMLAEAEKILTYRVCWCDFKSKTEDGKVNLEFGEYRSKSLAENLSGCHKVVIFAATVGIGLDRLIAKYGAVSPSKALMLQAIGAERIEALCEAFCGDMKAELDKCGKVPARRFSPGYGDLPLEMQKDIFRVLECSRKIGLTLNGSMLMSPSKSVTAIVGINEKLCAGENKKDCDICGKPDCSFRRNQ